MAATEHETGEHDAPVIDTISARTRRPRWMAGLVVTALTVIVALLAMWLVSPSDDAGRGALDPADAAATATGGTTDAATTDTATTDAPLTPNTEAFITTTSERPISTGPTSTVAAGGPTVMPNGSFYRVIMNMPCDNMPFHNAACTQAIVDYCTQTPPPEFFVPNLVGRDLRLGSLLTDAQHEQASAYEMCHYRRYPYINGNFEYVCNADPSVEGIVFEQLTPIGTAGHDLLPATGITVRVWHVCIPETSTTCVLMTLPPGPDVTTTVAWACG